MKSTGKIRIIAGHWRRRLLSVVESPGLRPTPSRVRETLFNWIGEDISGSVCVDLFAGTGALGLEAASRGAAQTWLVERDGGLCHHLKLQCQLLGADQIQIVCADALRWVAGSDVPVDYVFLDPPFGRYNIIELFNHLESSRLLKPSTVVYYECDLATGKGLDEAYPCGQAANHGLWRRSHGARAGRVSYNLFNRQY